MNLLQQASPCLVIDSKHPLTIYWFPPFGQLYQIPSSIFYYERLVFFLHHMFPSHLVSLCKAFDNVKSSSMSMTMQMKLVVMFWGALFK
jgi:hypothetical protein